MRAAMDARQDLDILHSADDPAKPAAATTQATKLMDSDPQLSAAVLLMRLEVAGVKL